MNKRQQIIAALKARLETIQTPTYTTDAGDRVYVWRAKPLIQSELPAIVIRYAEDPDTIVADLMRGPGLVWDRQLPVTIEIATKGAESTDEAEDIISDILKAIAVDDTFGSLVGICNLVDDSFNVQQEERIITGAGMKFNFTYRTDQYEH